MGLDLTNEEISFLDKALEGLLAKEAVEGMTTMLMTAVFTPPGAREAELKKVRQSAQHAGDPVLKENVLLLRAKLLMYSRERKEEQLKKQAEEALNKKGE